MRSIAPLRAAKIGYIVMSLFFCALGALMIAKHDLSVSLIGITAGVMLIAFGLVKLVGYFTKDLYRLAFQFDLAFGLTLIVVGAIVLMNPDHAMNFLCLVIGIAIMADALLKLQTAIDAKRFGLPKWWLILALAVVAGAVGAAVAFGVAVGCAAEEEDGREEDAPLEAEEPSPPQAVNSRQAVTARTINFFIESTSLFAF